MMQDYYETMGSVLATLEFGGRLRSLRAVAPEAGLCLEREGRSFINFSSNDYLGLAFRPELRNRAALFAERFGVGATASRLVCGTFDCHESIEKRIARLKGTEDALVLASGFQTNQSVLASLLDRDLCGNEPLVYGDRLNHASMHEGVRTAGVRQSRFRHNDLNHLEHLLRRESARPGPRFILTESVFSMDGDCADLPALCLLAERFGCFLYVDEAHATGVLGPGGAGLSAEASVKGRIDLVMGTFGKALGGFGSFVACSGRLKSWLVNRCRALIYSTALPPPVLGAVDAALDLLPTMEEERSRLRVYADRIRAVLQTQGHDSFGSETQIIPVRIGEDHAALAAARRLEEAGCLVVAIRPPTVPEGSARLRLALSAAHSQAQIATLIAALKELS